ncbi:MAG: hypothetical protein ABIM40_04140 [Pseudomonadota bacterium]
MEIFNDVMMSGADNGEFCWRGAWMMRDGYVGHNWFVVYGPSSSVDNPNYVIIDPWQDFGNTIIRDRDSGNYSQDAVFGTSFINTDEAIGEYK